jgi:cell wall-associated NlpC family hydrolase
MGWTIRHVAGIVALAVMLTACSAAPPYRAGETSKSETPEPSPTSNSPSEPQGWRQAYRGLLGVPYRYGGASRSGFDCSGLVGYVYRAYDGRRLPRNVTDLYRTGHEVEDPSLKDGDLVFFNTTGHGVSHVGIYLGNRRFLHASTSRGVIITHMDEDYYARRYMGARRL